MAVLRVVDADADKIVDVGVAVNIGVEVKETLKYATIAGKRDMCHTSVRIKRPPYLTSMHILKNTPSVGPQLTGANNCNLPQMRC